LVRDKKDLERDTLVDLIVTAK